MGANPPYGIGYESARHDGTHHAKSITGDSDTTLRDEILASWAYPFDPERPTPPRSRSAMVFGSPSAPPPTVRTRATLVWHKPGSGMGDLAMPWKPDYESIFVIG